MEPETLDQAEEMARPARRRRSRSRPTRFDWSGAATWLLAALLVLYLGLEDGGYDPIPRDQVGVAVWWLLLLGVAVQALPVPGRTRPALAALGLLGGFAVWTALAMTWSASEERTATEMARVVTYLGVLALGVCLVTRRRGSPRQVLHGVAFGLAFLCALGVLSRLHMAWFPANELGRVLPGIEIERRLAYPLGYSSAMGALAGMTLPLLLGATGTARTLAGQALAAAAIPVAGLTLYLATSGTGAAVAAVAVGAFLALSPDRLPKLLTLLTGTAGGAVLALALSGRDALARGLPTPAAESQGTEMVWIVLAVCAGVALAQVLISLAVRGADRPSLLGIGRREAMIATGVALLFAIPVSLAAGLPHEASHRWEVFKERGSGTGAEPSSPSSILNFHGSGRYQFWQSAIDAGESEPLKGLGPGTFELWWGKHATYTGFTRNAHSLYLEAFAELGWLGLLLICGFVFGVLGLGAVRAMRAPPDRRLVLATATAGAAGFATAAALDWVWQLGALAAAFALLAAVAVAGYSVRQAPGRLRRRTKRRYRNWAQRAATVAVAALALVAIWFPLSGATHLRQSQLDAARGDYAGALAEAEDAADAQPYAASPLLQQALVLERQGRLPAAEAKAAAAVDEEGEDWRNWFILARIRAERGEIVPALRAYRRAHVLNPDYGLLKV